MTDVVLTLMTRGVVIVAGLTTSIITARVLSVEGRGEYFYVVTLAAMAVQFGNLGLGSSNTYTLARAPRLLKGLAGNSFWLSMVIGPVAVLLIVLAEGVWAADALPGAPRLVALIMAPAMLYGLLAGNLLVGLSRIRDYNAYLIGSTLLQLTGVVIGGGLLWGPAGFLMVSAVAGLLGAIILVAMLRRLDGLGWRFDSGLLRDNLGYSGRAYLATLFGWGVGRSGVFLMGRWATTEDIGVYSIAIQFFDVLIILPATVALILFPKLVRDERGGRFGRAIKAAAIVGALMAVICGVTAWAAEWVIPPLFGEEFSPAARVLWWMLPGVLALSVINVVSQYLAAEGIPLENVWTWLGGLVVFVAFGSNLVPRFGAVGAAASLSLTYPLVLIALLSLAWRVRGHVR